MGKRKLKSAATALTLLAVIVIYGFLLEDHFASASETIYIHSDGSIDPSTAPIYTADNITYTLSDNVYDSIIIEKNSILIDGASYEVQGTGFGRGIDLSRRQNVTVKNMVVKAFETGIYCYNTLNSSVIENSIMGNSYGIRLYYSFNCTFDANNIANNISYNNPGVWLYKSSGNIFSRNSIVANNDFGVYLYFSSSNNFSGNNMTENNVGVFLYSSSSNVISGSYITGGNYSGVWLHSSSKHNIISGNNLTNNGSGAYIDSSSGYNTISRNNIVTNIDSGISLYYSSNNTLYSNNFVNNPIQVNATNSTNVWNRGYPSCGNHWSDYTGVDVYNGQYQNETGSDGVGDTPYVIDSDNQDRYPLINLWTAVSPTADFSYSPELPWVGKTVIFNALASISPSTFIVNYRWDFGDGTVANTSKAITVHAYAAKGIYDVNLTVTGIYGTNHTAIKPIEVISDNLAPVTLHNYDGLWHTSDFPVNLTATDSTPGSGVYETYYRINNGPVQNLSVRGQPRITTESANNRLEYWSTDNAGNEELPHKDLSQIRLDKTDPIAYAGTDQNIAQGTQVTFNASASTDQNGIANYTWTFIDTAPRTLTGKNPTYTYTAQGTYTVTLTVADPAGNNATDIVVITVTPAEAFPWWLVGAAIIAIGIAVSLALWRKRASSKTGN